ncbi:prepilin-type N-terminal cleavage/methylation domain-containing protein [Methylophaga sp. OBS4]|uniref:prepilin-type N-terminal cleavage/methylation domain-containing protein n=1 Tax=Methylophaga sp. OBS4 TaxID=2991935 RepID=UPI0022574235|nr:prepilin-type N-terminal cleavage/methylation domain-containing protein [Methylophaga sp. OBS4]MCX4187238.1 prepilin-type N-terminal cleavage/methylation domain-containing protein [Methylophaga sp. OBS4]
MKTNKRNKGFSLIEVMVALLMLAVGILGISKLQGTLIRNSSDANQRAVAVSLAQMKIDDLKSFIQVKQVDTNGDGVVDAADVWSAGLLDTQQSFAWLEDNKGGAAAGTDDSTGFSRDDLVTGDITFQNYEFNLSWNVTDYYYPAAASEASSTLPAGEAADFKYVTVVVRWDDETGSQQEVSLGTVVDSYAPALTALSDNSKEGGVPPLVAYTPEAAPDVINIQVDTGGGKYRQTSKPLPDAVKTGQDANTIVSFEVVTYSEYQGDLPIDFIADTLEEYVTVDCNCQFSSVNATARTAAHVRWDQSDNTRFDYGGDLVSKQTAVQVNNANAADELCTTCCRDHHDVDDATKPTYVPGTTGGNHVHYKADGTVASQALGDTYVESCRLKLVDGILRVFQDWQLYDNTTMLRSDLADGEALQTTYSTYVKNFVLDEVTGTTTASKPDDSTDISTSEGGRHQLQSRGVYIDEVYSDDGTSLSSEYLTYVSDDSNTDRANKIPFAEINLTLLSNWDSANETKVTVTDEPVATIADPDANYYGTYSRGFIAAIEDSAMAEIPVTATISDNNNGLTQITDASNVNVSDPVQVVVGPPGGEIAVSGTYGFSFPNGNNSLANGWPKISMTGDDQNCTLLTGNEFSCGMTSPWTGEITISVKVNGASGCQGTITYSGSNVTENTTVALSGTCS